MGPLVASNSPVTTGVALVMMAIATAIYLGAWWRRPDVGRPAAWVGAMIALTVAGAGPLASAAARTFTWHMVQHLVIVGLAAPALVFARPLRTIAAGFGLRWQSRWWRTRGRRIHDVALVGAPLASSFGLYVVHLTSAYETALRVAWFHEVQHLVFLAAGSALWWAVFGARTRLATFRLAAVVGATLSMGFLGMILTTMRRPISATYVARAGAEAALEDQRLGASLMWVGGMVITVPIVVAAIWRWAVNEDRIVHRQEELARDARSGAARS